MASYETLEQTANCVCGQGKLEREFYSSNNRYGGAWTGQAKITCIKCSQYWEFDSQDDLRPKPHLKPLWHKSDEMSALAAKVNYLKTEINRHIESALLREFNRVNAKTKAAQHRLLQKSKIYTGSYRQYLRDGLRPVMSKIDTESIVECEDLVKELDSAEYDLSVIRAEYTEWCLVNKYRLRYIAQWRL